MRPQIATLSLFFAFLPTTVTGFAGNQATFFPSPGIRNAPSSTPSHLHAAGNDGYYDGLFHDETNKARRTRLAREYLLHKRFATGEELKNLRLDLKSLRQTLQWAEAFNDVGRIQDLNKAIKKGENRDPDYVYTKAFKIMAQVRTMTDTSKEEKDALVEKWSKLAQGARECLPQFNLEGLWVGTYEDHGVQLVNVTYSSDNKNQLVATKVTGDINVPRGETSFTANLDPQNESVLAPIQVSSAGELKRFPGQGQVSRKGFNKEDKRFIEGQLVMIHDDQAFSFVWVPTKHQIFFSRPSPETTMRLLRDIVSKEDEVENMRNHVARCFDMDMTTCLARQQDPNTCNFEPFRRITTQDELDLLGKRSLLGEEPKFNFWEINMWRKNYIDQTLDDNNPGQ